MTLEKIKVKYNINDNNPKEIRKKLINIISELHPDKNGGDFENQESKKEYLEIKEDLECIDKIINCKEVSVDILQNKLIEKKTELIQIQIDEEKKSKIIDSFKESIKNNKNIIRKDNRKVKISSSVALSVVSFIFMFPNTMNENPFISNIMNSEQGMLFLFVVWLYVLIITIVVFLYYKNVENIIDYSLDLLNDEMWQNNVFIKFSELLRNNVKFSKDMLVEYLKNEILKYFENNHISGLFSSRRNIIINIKKSIDRNVYYNAAEVIINRAINKNIIKEVNSNTLESVYELNKDNIK